MGILAPIVAPDSAPGMVGELLVASTPQSLVFFGGLDASIIGPGDPNPVGIAVAWSAAQIEALNGLDLLIGG